MKKAPPRNATQSCFCFLPFYVFPFFVCTLAPLSTTSLVSSRPTSTDLPMRGPSTPRVRLPPTNLREGAKDSSRAPQPIPMRGSTRYVGCTARPLTPFTTSRTNSTYSLYGWARGCKVFWCEPCHSVLQLLSLSNNALKL